MTLFTDKIDRDKNWIIKFGTSLILGITLVIAYALITVEVPVFDELTLIKDTKNNTYQTLPTTNLQHQYTPGNTLIMIVNNSSRIEFDILNSNNKTSEITLKTTHPINTSKIINAKVFIKNESLLAMILHMEL